MAKNENLISIECKIKSYSKTKMSYKIAPLCAFYNILLYVGLFILTINKN